MYPQNLESPINLFDFKNVDAVIDIIYNPLKTSIARKAEELGIKAVNGLYMLVAQAVYASGIFMDTKYDTNIINNIYNKILKQKSQCIAA